MRWQDGGSSRGDGGFDQPGIDTQGARVDVHVHGRATLPHDAGGGRHITEGSGDHLPAQVERPGSNLQCDGAIGHKEEIFYTQVLFEPGFQFFY